MKRLRKRLVEVLEMKQSQSFGSPTEKGDPQKEYEDISNNLRHYGNLQFSQLTVFVVINLAMLNLVFGGTNPPHLPKIILEIMGLSLSVLFLVMTTRITAHWSTYSKRAMRIPIYHI